MVFVLSGGGNFNYFGTKNMLDDQLDDPGRLVFSMHKKKKESKFLLPTKASKFNSDIRVPTLPLFTVECGCLFIDA